MTEKEIKRKLEDDGFRVVDVARHLAVEFPTISEKSAETVLREMIRGDRYIQKYADWLKTNYEVVIEKPKSAKPVRERMKIAA